MSQLKIIGHRGVPSLKLENTLSSIKEAIHLGVPMIEFDVHLTKDNQVVLSHDSNLFRLGGGNYEISKLSYAELQKHPLKNGECVPLLTDIMEVVGSTPIFIEIKSENTVEQVLKVIDKFPAAHVSIASPINSEITRLKLLRKQIPGYIRSITNPFDIVSQAKAIGADGLDLNFWILNPLTYWLAKRNKMSIMVYTVNNRLFARFIHLFYPDVMICTNYPQYFIRKKHSFRFGNHA